MAGDGLYLPAYVARRRRAARSIAEIAEEIPGPDRRYQDHAPTVDRSFCNCGDMDCPWYRGEMAARHYARLSAGERVAMGREAIALMKSYFGDL